MKKEEVDLSKLSKREQMYYRVLRSNSGVLNLIGRPGVSKTSTLRALAKKMGWAFFDLRLTTMDETDLGSYPLLRQLDDIDVVTYAIPDWAIEANKANQGALIVFEELNRANITLRNAALKVLLEKEIGTKFKFADHVHMCATGNLGADDDTEVETFDAALKSRLITFEHKMDLEEWSEEFGNENIHSDIMYFLKHNPHQYHPTVKTEDARTITNPRTWTFLSDYIIANFGKDSRYADYIADLEQIGPSFVNNATILEFLKFTKEKNSISFQDILDNKNNILSKKFFDKLDRDIVARLMTDIKEINLNGITKKQCDNLIEFLKYAEQDSLTNFLYEILSSSDIDEDSFSDKKSNVSIILRSFPKEVAAIEGRVDDDEKPEVATAEKASK